MKHGATRRPGQSSSSSCKTNKEKVTYKVNVYRKISPEEISRLMEEIRKKQIQDKILLDEARKKARIQSFIERAQKVGLAFTTIQAEFLLDEFSHRGHDQDPRLK